jgi:hypothetical protein
MNAAKRLTTDLCLQGFKFKDQTMVHVMPVTLSADPKTQNATYDITLPDECQAMCWDEQSA